MIPGGSIPPGTRQSSGRPSDRFQAEAAGPSLADVRAYLENAKESAAKYVAAQVGRVRSIVRSAVLFGIIIGAALISLITIIVIATVLIVTGVANAISAALGDRHWAGDLITGIFVISMLAVCLYVITKRILRGSREATIKSFESQSIGK